MDALEKSVDYKIFDIVDKLQKMDYSLLGNKDPAWIDKLLFQAGLHRFHLMEWILSKLEYDVKGVSGSQDSVEDRQKNLQTAFNDLGLCPRSEIIKGTADKKDQLEFWSTLINILFTREECLSYFSLTETDEGMALSESDGMILSEKNKRKFILEEYDENVVILNTVFEEIDLSSLLKEDFTLVAPDVELEIKNLPDSEIDTIWRLEQMKDFVQKTPSSNYKDAYCRLTAQPKISFTENKDDVIAEEELSELENSMLETCTLVQDFARKRFSETFNELKPHIQHVKPDEFTDVGPDFRKAEQNLEPLLELKKNLNKLSSLYSKIDKVTLELEKLSSENKLTDSKSISIASLLKEGC